jgi:sec-independent protein translocase protein TatA
MGFGEVIVVVIVLLFVFGANKIPQLGDAIGRGVRNFKKQTRDDAIDVTPRRDALPGDATDPRPKP